MKRTIVQRGESTPRDLFAFVHLDPTFMGKTLKETAATDDAVVCEVWGNGTSAYKPLLAAYGGSWRGYVSGIEAKINTKIRNGCLTTWSAGSQYAKDVLLEARADWSRAPEAVIMLDGLYAGKPPGSKMGDGKVNPDEGLKAIAAFAKQAARGGKTLVLVHSDIPTEYASSKECCAWVVAEVENDLGLSLGSVISTGVDKYDAALLQTSLDGRTIERVQSTGNFHVIGYRGRDAKEHIAEAHLFPHVWRLFVPWAHDAGEPVPEVPEVLVCGPRQTIPELALQISLELADAHVGEDKAGSSPVEYWAGTTRIQSGKEVLIKIARTAPWCAAGAQWSAYEAARQLGIDGVHEPDDWRRGPIPHGRRVSVLELQNDHKARGLFWSRADVAAGRYDPQPGDLVFLDRAGTAGKEYGHVARFARRLDRLTFESVGGNESGAQGDADFGQGRWRRTIRKYDEPRIRGFGAYPRDVTGETCVPLELGPAELDRILRAARDWAAHPTGSAERGG